MPNNQVSQPRRLRGIVVSDRMAKTVVVRVDRVIRHPKYGKQLRLSKRYHAHDEKNEFKVGQKVVIQASRPRSRLKRWIAIARQ